MARLRVVEVACVALAVTASSAVADVIIQLDKEFSGAQAPVGTAPWITATFQNAGANTVDLVIQANLTGAEWMKSFYFNITAPIIPTSVSIAQMSGDPTTGAPLKKATNPGAVTAFKADGDGYFDFRIDWDNGVFTQSDVAVFRLTRAAGLDESWFNDGSEPGGGNGTYHAAAKIQSIGPSGSGSGWIGNDSPPEVVVIPLPATAGLALSGLFAVGGIRRRRA